MALELNGTTGVSLVQDGVITDANLPAGSVLQVAQSGTFTDSIVSTANTWTDTDLSITITPTSASNKILVAGSVPIYMVGTGSIIRGSIKVTRSINGGAATDIWNTDEQVELFQVRDAANEHGSVGSVAILDSPSTTDSVVYRVMARYQGDSGTTQIRVWGSARGSRLIAQEIAG